MSCEEVLMVCGIVDVLVFNCCYYNVDIYVCYVFIEGMVCEFY